MQSFCISAKLSMLIVAVPAPEGGGHGTPPPGSGHSLEMLELRDAEPLLECQRGERSRQHHQSDVLHAGQPHRPTLLTEPKITLFNTTWKSLPLQNGQHPQSQDQYL